MEKQHTALYREILRNVVWKIQNLCTSIKIDDLDPRVDRDLDLPDTFSNLLIKRLWLFFHRSSRPALWSVVVMAGR